MQETWKEIVTNAVVFLALCAAVIVVGWNEPLSHRFISEQQIAEQENPAPVEPAATPRLAPANPTTWKSQLSGTSLDRRPYSYYNGRVRYSTSVDPNRLGTASETDRRNGLERGKEPRGASQK